MCAKNDYAPEPCSIPYCDAYFDIPFARSPFSLKNIRAYRMLKERIEAEDYDIIHCHTPMGGVLTRLAARRARKRGTKIIYTAHGFHFYKGAPLINWLLYYPVEKWLARHTDVLITINAQDYALAQKHMAAKEVVFVPGVGIALEKFSPDKALREKTRRELGVEGNCAMLLSVGELTSRKNHIRVIRALKGLDGENSKYFICGSGKLEAYLRRQIEENGMRQRVFLLGFRKDVAALCSAADLFLFPSRQEGLPVALMEAAASGLPCIANRIRGCEDIAKTGADVLLLKDETKAWQEGIQSALEGLKTKRRTCENTGRSMELFSTQSVLGKLAEIYQKYSTEE